VIELRAGLSVTPNLRLLHLVGEGAMGCVWVAEHLGLDTKVAVKFISHTRPKDRPALVARFEREAKAAARIKSPHVVQVFDHGVMEGDTPYFVMELLDGETLGGRLRRAGAMSIGEVEQVVVQVCRALSKAHELGIVHRDIKPDNIFLVKGHDELLVKVVDFGIAKHVEQAGDTMTQTGALLGTPLYMSPERIKSARDADLSADLWGIAVVAYEALTGRPPFTGETVGALFFSICGDPPTPPSELREDVPAAVDAWFSRALRHELDKRFPTARDMASAFRRALGKDTLDEAPGDTLVAAARTAPPADTIVEDAALATGEFVSKHELEVAATISATRAASPAASPAGKTIPGEPAPTPQEGGDTHATFAGTKNEEPERPRRRWVPAVATLAVGALAAFGARAWLSDAPSSTLGALDNDWSGEAARAAASVEPQPTASAETSAPKLGEEDIRKVLDSHKDAYQRCYQERRKKRPELNGTLNVALVISSAGEVRNVIVGGIADVPLRQCVRTEVQNIRFPAPGAEIEVSYPMTFGERPAGRVMTTNVGSTKKAPIVQSNAGPSYGSKGEPEDQKPDQKLQKQTSGD
jgi:serine/threonine-protein kinase